MSTESEGSFATLTHARLRAAQGDVGGAARILRVILEVQPGHQAARDLLADLEHSIPVARKEPPDVAPEPARAATAEDLKDRFRGALEGRAADPRVLRLSVWLERVERNRGERRVR